MGLTPVILVVDDNPDITRIVSLVLKSRGYDTASAADGAQALAMLEKHRPDLIICDIMMPEMDGFQLFHRVRSDRRWHAIPFAFLTALSDPETRISSSELGVEAFIPKPFNNQELLSVVGGLLRRAQELQHYSESELESLKAQLLFMITHELNTPLSVIRILLENLRNHPSRLAPEQLAEHLDLLVRSTNDLSYMIESMLLALQIDSGHAQQIFETWATPQPIGLLLDTTIARLRQSAVERKVTIHRSGDQAPFWIQAHQEQMLQVFSRLLDNAIRFSPALGEVTVAVKHEQGRVRITFEDQGPGMTPEEAATIFKRFHQVNRARQEQQGTGLSLNLVRSLVTIHGGEVTVEVLAGKGCRFVVALPLVEPPG